MQTCSLCLVESPDTARDCIGCGAALSTYSSTSIARSEMVANPRVVRLRLIVAGDACPSCREAQGDYAKDSVPVLPIPGCSHHQGCRCFYEPYLSEIFP
jgi:Zn ribbon nucleic-acid-binding protein